MTGPSAHPGWALAPGWGVVDRPDDGEHGGRLYVAPLLTGEITVVEGPAAVVARAALAGHTGAELSSAVASELRVASEEVDDEVLEQLVDELRALGVLRRVAPQVP